MVGQAGAAPQQRVRTWRPQQRSRPWQRSRRTLPQHFSTLPQQAGAGSQTGAGAGASPQQVSTLPQQRVRPWQRRPPSKRPLQLLLQSSPEQTLPLQPPQPWLATALSAPPIKAIPTRAKNKATPVNTIRFIPNSSNKTHGNKGNTLNKQSLHLADAALVVHPNAGGVFDPNLPWRFLYTLQEGKGLKAARRRLNNSQLPTRSSNPRSTRLSLTLRLEVISLATIRMYRIVKLFRLGKIGS